MKITKIQKWRPMWTTDDKLFKTHKLIFLLLMKEKNFNYSKLLVVWVRNLATNKQTRYYKMAPIVGL